MFFFQAEDGIRDLVRSRGLGDVYKRQALRMTSSVATLGSPSLSVSSTTRINLASKGLPASVSYTHLTLPTKRSSVDLGGRRIIKKNNRNLLGLCVETADTRDRYLLEQVEIVI